MNIPIKNAYVIVTILLALCLADGAVIAQPYNLKLGREVKVTDAYLLNASAQRSTRLLLPRQDGTVQVVPQGSSMIQLQANCKVLAVTVDGQEAQKSVNVRNAGLTRDTESSNLLPAGYKFTATFSDTATRFEHDGHPLPDSISNELALVVRGEGGQKTGSIMNPTKPVNIGDKWPMNKKAFVKLLDAPTAKRVKNIKGTVTFERVDTVRGIPVAVVILEASATNVIPSTKEMRVTKSLYTTRIELTVPLDVRYPPIHSHTLSIWRATIPPPDKKGTPIEMEMEHSDDVSLHR